MALLMATDSWGKVEECAKFIAQNGQVVWRTCGRNQQSLQEIREQLRIKPINLYLFNKNLVKYHCRCIDIKRDSPRSEVIKDVPPTFRDEPTRYTLFFWFEKIVCVQDTHIHKFRKWRKPRESFKRGLLGLQKAFDLPIPELSAA